MRGFRLNGWQRIGIVLSVVWAIGALVYVWQDHTARSATHQKLYYKCMFAPDGDTSLCDARDQALRSASRRVTVDLLTWSLAPIPIAWLLVWGLVALVRWVRRGFQPST